MVSTPTWKVLMKWCSWALLCGVALGAGMTLGGSPLFTAALLNLAGGTSPEKVFAKDTITILALGVDANYGRRGFVTFDHTRSDTMMVARLDLRQKRAFLISIPRDTYVEIPGRRGRSKINAANAYGGPELAKATVENMLGVEIDYVATLNYQGFRRLVDEVGGVWVDVEKNMKYTDRAAGLYIDLKKGPQVLNGEQAMGYVRFRHTDNDFLRGKRQQKFLLALQRRIAEQPPVAIPRIAEAVRRSVSGLDANQLAALMIWGRSLDPATDVKSVILPTRYIGSRDFGPDHEAIARMLDAVDWPRRGETASTDFTPSGS